MGDFSIFVLFFIRLHYLNYCQEIRKKAAKNNKNVSYDNLMIITAVQWSNDFDQNGFCKNNRGSVWIKTLTFFSSDYDSNKIENTYPLSIGLKRIIMILSNRR